MTYPTFSCILLAAILMLQACGNPFVRESKYPELSADTRAQAKRMDVIEQAINEGNYSEAQTALDQAIAEGYNHPRVAYFRGRLLSQDNTPAGHERSILWFRKAIERSPGWPEPRIHLAQAYIRTSRLAAATTAFSNIDTMFPKHPAGSYGKAYVAFLSDDNNEADQFIREALQRQADYAPALQLGARIAAMLGDTNRQETLLQRYLLYQPTEASAWISLAQIARGRNHLIEAERLFLRAYNLHPDQTIAAQLADLARQQNDTDAAAHWDTLSGQKPQAEALIPPQNKN